MVEYHEQILTFHSSLSFLLTALRSFLLAKQKHVIINRYRDNEHVEVSNNGIYMADKLIAN